MPFSISYLQLALAHARNSRVKKGKILMENLIQFSVFMEVFRGWSPRSLVEKKRKENRVLVFGRLFE